MKRITHEHNLITGYYFIMANSQEKYKIYCIYSDGSGARHWIFLHSFKECRTDMKVVQHYAPLKI